MSARFDTFLSMVGQITGKMVDHPIEKDCVSDLSDQGSCRTGPGSSRIGKFSNTIFFDRLVKHLACYLTHHKQKKINSG